MATSTVGVNDVWPLILVFCPAWYVYLDRFKMHAMRQHGCAREHPMEIPKPRRHVQMLLQDLLIFLLYA